MRAGTFALLTLSVVSILGLAGASVTAQEKKPLEAQFEAAAHEHEVPENLLLAMGYVNTRWEMPSPKTTDYESRSVEGRGAYGVMSLYHNPSKDTLGEAAKLTGLSETELKNDSESNIRGAAAVLSEMQGERPSSVNGWYEAVAEYGDGTLYADQVYQTLKSGARATTSTGERLSLEPDPEAEPQQTFSSLAAADYGRATFYGAHSNNYTNANRGSAKIDRIVIHVTQGSWSSAINWFQNPDAYVSAHYVVRSSDGKIGQSVRDRDIAYHAGNWNYNTQSIGIEHEGYIDQSKWFTDAMYRSSARLAASLSKKWGIPVDRRHIIGHNQVPGSDHTDPGRHWNWDKYMRLVRKYRSGGSVYSQIVDNSSSRFGASGGWNRSAYDSQRRGRNYRFATRKDVDDGARFRLKTPKDGTYNVYAWWPANSGYTGSARFWILGKSGWHLEVRSQRKNGGKWVRLGSYRMGASDKVRVKISRRSETKGYIIADAVKIRKS